MQQLKSGFKITIDWNKNHSNVSIERRNQYLDFLIDPRFQGVNTFFILLLENNANRTGDTEYFLKKVAIKA